MDISLITDYLYVGAQPQARHAQHLQALNVRLIISMRGETRPLVVFTQPPFASVWLKTYDIFLLPIPVNKLMEGALAALPVIRAGGKVFTHCQRGKHRSVAMAAAILIAMGHSAEAAMRLLRERRPIADPHAWYVKPQIEKFEQQWQVSRVS